MDELNDHLLADIGLHRQSAERATEREVRDPHVTTAALLKAAVKNKCHARPRSVPASSKATQLYPQKKRLPPLKQTMQLDVYPTTTLVIDLRAASGLSTSLPAPGM